LHRSPGKVHLEAVALRRDTCQINATQCARAEGPVTARRIMQRNAQHDSGVGVAALRQNLSTLRPILCSTTGYPPRAQYEVGVHQRVQETVQLLGLVRPVGIHFDENIEVAFESPGEPGDVRRSKTSFGRAVHDVNVIIRGRQRVGDRSGPIGRIVVGDQDVCEGDARSNAGRDLR